MGKDRRHSGRGRGFDYTNAHNALCPDDVLRRIASHDRVSSKKKSNTLGKLALYDYIATAKDLFYGDECIDELKKCKTERECEMVLATYRRRLSDKELEK